MGGFAAGAFAERRKLVVRVVVGLTLGFGILSAARVPVR